MVLVLAVLVQQDQDQILLITTDKSWSKIYLCTRYILLYVVGIYYINISNANKIQKRPEAIEKI